MEYFWDSNKSYFRKSSYEPRMVVRELEDRGYTPIKDEDSSISFVAKSTIACAVALYLTGFLMIIARKTDFFDKVIKETVLQGYLSYVFAAVIIVILAVFIVSILKKNKRINSVAVGRCVGYDDAILKRSGRYSHQSYVGTAPVYEMNVGGQSYLVYSGKHPMNYNFPEIGESVDIRYNPNNPYDCIISRDRNNKGDYILIGITLLIVIIISLSSGSKQVDYMKYSDDGRIIVNDGYIINDTDFRPGDIRYVAYRTVVSYENNVVKCRAVLGDVNEYDVEGLNVSAGDAIYVVGLKDGGLRYFSADEFFFDGTVSFIEDEYTYTENGKCVIDDEMLLEFYKAQSIRVLTVAYQYSSDGNYQFRDPSGSLFIFESGNEGNYHFNSNEMYYYIIFDDSVALVVPMGSFDYHP